MFCFVSTYLFPSVCHFFRGGGVVIIIIAAGPEHLGRAPQVGCMVVGCIRLCWLHLGSMDIIDRTRPAARAVLAVGSLSTASAPAIHMGLERHWSFCGGGGSVTVASCGSCPQEQHHHLQLLPSAASPATATDPKDSQQVHRRLVGDARIRRSSTSLASRAPSALLRTLRTLRPLATRLR